MLQYLSYFLFYRFLNASCTLALLLFLYCALDKSAYYISVFIMAAAIFLNLSLLVDRIGGFILGQNQWAIIACIVLYSLSMCFLAGPSFILSVQVMASFSKYIQSGRNPILYSSTAISVNLYAPTIIQRHQFYTASSQCNLVLLISLGFVYSGSKYQVLYLYKIAG